MSGPKTTIAEIAGSSYDVCFACGHPGHVASRCTHWHRRCPYCGKLGAHQLGGDGLRHCPYYERGLGLGNIMRAGPCATWPTTWRRSGYRCLMPGCTRAAWEHQGAAGPCITPFCCRNCAQPGEERHGYLCSRLPPAPPSSLLQSTGEDGTGRSSGSPSGEGKDRSRSPHVSPE